MDEHLGVISQCLLSSAETLQPLSRGNSHHVSMWNNLSYSLFFFYTSMTTVIAINLLYKMCYLGTGLVPFWVLCANSSFLCNDSKILSPHPYLDEVMAVQMSSVGRINLGCINSKRWLLSVFTETSEGTIGRKDWSATAEVESVRVREGGRLLLLLLGSELCPFYYSAARL